MGKRITFIIDTSTSVNRKNMKRIVDNYIKSIKYDISGKTILYFYEFSSSITYYYKSELKYIREYNVSRSRGCTRLYDTIWTIVEIFEQREPMEEKIVIISDGVDNFSIETREDTLNMLNMKTMDGWEIEYIDDWGFKKDITELPYKRPPKWNLDIPRNRKIRTF